MMKKITRDDNLACSADLAAQNVQRLAELFPEAVVEGRVDLDVLRQLLGEHLELPGERFGLSWKGKAAARQLALQPSTGTLRPYPEESVDWDKTQNVFIEGDNLEVLKLLQKSYQGQVKVVFIDPPYNTGGDFVYPDDFRDGVDRYLRITGQKEDDGLTSTSNVESSGRFHTNWLNMMLPRLKLARELLRDDGSIFITIDDNEVAHLIELLDEVFGEENRIAIFAWQKKYAVSNNSKGVASTRDHVVAYAKSDRFVCGLLPRDEESRARYINYDNDPRGPWKPVDYWNQASPEDRPNLVYPIVNPNTGVTVFPDKKAWKFSREVHEEHVREGRIWWGTDGTNSVPALKLFLADVRDGLLPHDWWPHEKVGHTDEAKKELNQLFDGNSPFDTPKPLRLLTRIFQVGNLQSGELVMDFFAGSGTTGHAAMAFAVGASPGPRFILAQLPEATSRKDYPTISAITKERLRRAGKKLRAENPMFAGDLQPDDLERQIELAIEHVKPGRSEADLLTELLLKLGLELTVPVDTHTIAGHTVYAVGGGALLACLSPQIPRADVEGLAAGLVALHQKLKPASVEPEGASARPKPAREATTVIFRDAAFADDVAKVNLSAILEQHGLHNLRSL